MMVIKSDFEITRTFFGKTILDGDLNSPYSTPSEYWFFVKKTGHDLENKFSLVIVDSQSGYVVNNDLRFNSIEIEDRKIKIYRMANGKRSELIYWFKN